MICYWFVVIFNYALFKDPVTLEDGTATNLPPTPKDAIAMPPLLKFLPPKSFVFPKRSFGKDHKRLRSCLGEWLETNQEWAHYDVEQDTVICYICYETKRLGKVTC